MAMAKQVPKQFHTPARIRVIRFVRVVRHGDCSAVMPHRQSSPASPTSAVAGRAHPSKPSVRPGPADVIV